MENSQIDRFRSKLNIRNKKGAIIYLRTIIFVDIFFYFFALIENDYPSSPFLLRLMILNIILNLSIYLVAKKNYLKNSQFFEYMVPLLVIGGKITYIFVIGFDINLLVYILALFMFLNMGIISKWSNFISALILSAIILIASFFGFLDLSSEYLSSIYITTMIVSCFAIWSYSKYNVEYEQFITNDELVRNADRIQSFVKLRDLTIDLNHKIVEHVSLDEFFDYLLEKIIELIDKADAASVLTVKDDSLVILSSVNYNEEDTKTFAIPVDYSFVFQSMGKAPMKPEIINDAQKFIDRDFVPLVRTSDNKEIESVLSTTLLIDGEFYGLFNLDSTNNNIFNDDDISTMEYISEQINIVLNNHALYQKIKKLSEIDQLTGFYNRWSLDTLLENEKEAKRLTDENLLICLVDLDNLKSINDTLGHAVGDNYIKNFCDIIQNHVTKETKIIRYGGDEFILLIRSYTFKEIDNIMRMAQIEYATHAYGNETKTIYANFSYGIESFNLNVHTFEEVLKLVDSKMYMQKRSHKLKELLK